MLIQLFYEWYEICNILVIVQRVIAIPYYSWESHWYFRCEASTTSCTCWPPTIGIKAVIAWNKVMTSRTELIDGTIHLGDHSYFTLTKLFSMRAETRVLSSSRWSFKVIAVLITHNIISTVFHVPKSVKIKDQAGISTHWPSVFGFLTFC